MTENNADQAAMQDAVRDAIRKAYDDGYNDAKMDPKSTSTYCGQAAARHGTDALLSKVRAEGVQAGEPQCPRCALPLTQECNCDEGYARRAALASAPVAGEARPAGWQNALRIAELPEVDKALAAFCDDGTQDNAVGLVLAILDAAPQASEAYTYARNLAVTIWEKRFKRDAPEWKPCEDLIGVLTQIDNMTSGLVVPQADKDGGDCAKGAGDAAPASFDQKAREVAHSVTFYGDIQNRVSQAAQLQCAVVEAMQWAVRQHSAALSPEPAQGWQPIETAPKGEVMLLFGGLKKDGKVYAPHVNVGYWTEQFGWTCLVYAHQEFAHIEPTHWMPRPPFPTQPSKDGGAEHG